MTWVRHTLLLCNYGFLKELRPGTPFITPYLIADKNFTDPQLYGHIYPFWTYSYLFLLVPAFALTDLLRYKPVIFVEIVCLISTWAVLILGNTVLHMQFMQILFGAASAAEVAYFAYIYAAVDTAHYAAVTSYVRAATLAGQLVGYTVSQILVSSGIMNGYYQPLNYVSLVALCLAAPCALMLPKVKQVPTSQQNTVHAHGPLPVTTYSWQREVFHYFKDTLLKLRTNYSNRLVLRWSLWWALATCGYLQVGNYIQTLWATMQLEQADVLNGVVEAINRLLGLLVAFSMQFVHVNWPLLGEPVLAACTIIMAGLLLLGALSYNLWAAYAVYVAVCVAYQMLITVATYNVSRHCVEGTYGLVIGGNTFVALLLQTALTFAVADAHGLALHIVHQFCVYSGFFLLIGVLYLIMSLVTIRQSGGCKQYMALATAPVEDAGGDGDGEEVVQGDCDGHEA